MISLPNVTLFGIDSFDPSGLLRAAEICQRGIKFGKVKMITDDLFTKGGTPHQRREDYSRFCIQDMAKYITTSHVLIIHPDGYIQDPTKWNDDWLQWDYIGATWGYKDNMNNGNGGFCLRSKKLLDILARTELTNYHPEDDIICRQLRPWLEQKFSIKFAPEEVCNKFSIEAYGVNHFIDSGGFRANTYTDQFGFHGKHCIGLPIPMPARGVQFGKPYVKQRRVR